jgi:hypothetical protein
MDVQRTVMVVALVLLGAAVGYGIALALGVSGGGRAIFAVLGILLVGGLANRAGIGKPHSRA